MMFIELVWLDLMRNIDQSSNRWLFKYSCRALHRTKYPEIHFCGLEISSISTEMFPAPSSYWFFSFVLSSLLAVWAYAQG